MKPGKMWGSNPRITTETTIRLLSRFGVELFAYSSIFDVELTDLLMQIVGHEVGGKRSLIGYQRDRVPRRMLSTSLPKGES